MDQEQVKPQGGSRPASGSVRWPQVLGLCGGGLVVIGVGLYLVRGHLAAVAVESYLRSQGVASAVVMDELGWAGLGGRLRIGPASAPDLTIDHLEVDFGDRPGQVRSVHLSGVTLHVAVVNGRPVAGQLQHLIEHLSRPGARQGSALPDVDVTNGQVLLDEAGVRTRLAFDGQVRGGHLQHLSLSSGPGVRHAGPVTVEVRSAHLRLQRTDGTYDLDLDATLGPGTLSGATPASMAGATLALTGRIADVTAPGLSGPLRLKGQMSADGLVLAAAHGRSARLDLDVDGVTRGALSHPGFTGNLSTTLTGTAIGTAAVHADDATLTAKWVGAAEMSQDAGPSAAGQVTAALRSRASQAATGKDILRIRDVQALLAGPVQLARAGLSGRLAADLSGRSEMSAPDAERLAGATPVMGTDPALHRALAAALQAQRLSATRVVLQLSPGANRVELTAPLRLTANGGAELSVSPGTLPLLQSRGEDRQGAVAVTLKGGGLPELALTVRQYAVHGGSGSADLSVSAQSDFGVFRGLRVATPAHLETAAGHTTLTLPGCAPLALAAVTGKPSDLVTGMTAQLCPAPGAPVLSVTPGHWQMRATARKGSAVLPTSEAKVEDITADLAFNGGAGGPVGTVHLTRAAILDTASNPRFRPLSTTGTVSLAAGHWTGRFEVAGGGKGTPLAVATLAHDTARQEGTADITAAKIAFTPDGLQPGDLSAAAAKSVWRVTGEASFAGHYAWKANTPVTSSGEASVHFKDFHLGAGTGSGLQTHLTFTGLGPLSTAPDQVATIDRIESVTPITGIEVHYRLTPKTVEVASAVALAGSGKVTLDPLSLLLAPRSSAQGQIKVVNVDIGSILSSTDLADKISLKAVVAGVVPFTLGPEGLRVANGRLVSVGPGRLSIKRQVLAGSAPGGPATSGTVKDIAYQALENLAFDDLDGVLESRPNGRLGLILHIRGRHDPDKALPSQINLIDVLRGRMAETPLNLPKGTPVNLTLDTSINFDDLMQTLAHPERDAADTAAPQKP